MTSSHIVYSLTTKKGGRTTKNAINFGPFGQPAKATTRGGAWLGAGKGGSRNNAPSGRVGSKGSGRGISRSKGENGMEHTRSQGNKRPADGEGEYTPAEGAMERAYIAHMVLYNKKVRQYGPNSEKTPSAGRKGKASMGDSTAWKPRGAHSFTYETNEDEEININLRSADEKDPGIPYIMYKNSSFGLIYEDYAAKIDVDAEQIRLLWRGMEVNTYDTPGPLGITNGEKLRVEGINTKLNIDTRYKGITIQECSDEGEMKLSLKVPMTRPLEDIHKTWAMFVATEPDEFELVYRKKGIGRSGVAGDVPLKNGAVLFCVRPFDLF